LASALYKLVYGSAKAPKEEVRNIEGMKAFFANDPSKALSDLKDLSQLDINKDGRIDTSELLSLQARKVDVNFGDKLFELFSTHPNMLKRIKRLSEWSKN
jgi:heat shock protein HtpX